ncbi:MAG TPA: DUF5995 family protein [Longimicrobium sp.]|jgi:hypothetical protein
MPASALIALLDQPWQTIDDVVDGLMVLEHWLRERRDRRAVFASAYLDITLAVRRRSSEGHFFADDAWVRRYDVAFANLYREALFAFARGDHQNVPKAWRFSFETSATGDALVLQDLLLGINAHINHDLPLALEQVSIDPREGRLADHTRVNEALQAATDPLQDRIAGLYAPALRVLDRIAGRIDEDIAGFSVRKARQACWDNAVLLAEAGSDEGRAAVRRRLDDSSAVLARLILTSLPAGGPLTRALKEMEEHVPWWELLPVAGGADGGAGPAPVEPEPPLVGSLDELIAKLEETVRRFDAARSRLSVYPSTYLFMERRFREALAGGGGGFEDRAWAELLDRHFATRYFRALEAHEAGRAAEVPECWKAAFSAATGGKTTLVQDLALAVNARLNYDLPLALLAAGVGQGAERERRRRDLLKFEALFRASIDPVQDMLAAKYSPFLKVLDLAGLRLDEFLVDFSYRRARDAAWDNAVRLADCASPEERALLVREIDRRAADVANRILLRTVIGGGWVAQAVRQVEDRWQGRWSAWVEPEG